MYELVILNLKNNQKFSKIFDSLYLLNNFKKKARHSKDIKIVAEFKN